MNIQEQMSFSLRYSIVVIFLVVLAVLVACQNIRLVPMGHRHVSRYIDRHKNAWIDLLTNNNEVLPFLEQLYTKEDVFLIVLENGELTPKRWGLGMFSHHELKKMEELFKMFQWDNIMLRKQPNTERKVLEMSSPQMKIGKSFLTHFCTVVIVYSPDYKLNDGEEIFPDWYYIVYYESI
ncbi:MAG: hypothetical protein LBC84_06585 [Prevotellaceae bacterium]|jgi:hypothetical protein|nr:hypothetical protein [Prevotellaceae bacterium]